MRCLMLIVSVIKPLNLRLHACVRFVILMKLVSLFTLSFALFVVLSLVLSSIVLSCGNPPSTLITTNFCHIQVGKPYFLLNSHDYRHDLFLIIHDSNLASLPCPCVAGYSPSLTLHQ
jgi:hypothetical protein